MRFKSFNSVVQDICIIQMNDPMLKQQHRVSRALRAVLNEWNFYLSTPVRTKQFTISDNYTIQMPADCQMPTKVGVLYEDNRFKLFGRNENVWRKPRALCACSETSTTEGCTICTFHNATMIGNRFGELYTYRPDPWANGEWKYDTLSSTIMLSSGDDVAIGGKVLVEYIVVDNNEALNMIPAEMVMLLGWRVAEILTAQTAPGVSSFMAQERAMSWDSLVRSYNTFRPDELISALMGESMSAPKTA